MNLSIKSLLGSLALCALAACGGSNEQLPEARQSVSEQGPYEPPPSAHRMPERPVSDTESGTH